jgi:Fe-S oxidoreductase
VLDVVRSTESHSTAEWVHRMVRRRLPRVSPGPVYRNLRLLVAEGLVEELSGPHARFDGNVSEHHRFTCLGCGRISDVNDPTTEPHSRALCGRVAAEEGVTLQDRFLGNTELVGRIGSLTAPVSNWMNAVWVNRKFMEIAAGIHAQRNLPPFHRETFSRWFDGRKPDSRPQPARDRVALFATCSVEYKDPATGKAAVAVLEKNGVDVTLPAQRCCGMPYLDGGAVTEARRLIADKESRRGGAAGPRDRGAGADLLLHAQRGVSVARRLRGRQPVAAHTRDLFEYLALLHDEGRLDTRFPNAPGTIAYQLPCHLRAQNMGTRSADVLRLTEAPVEVIERCSAVDGTWGMKKEYFELSMKLAGPLFRDVEQTKPERVATDCPLRPADPSGHRARRAPPDPDPGRGLRSRAGGPVWRP